MTLFLWPALIAIWILWLLFIADCWRRPALWPVFASPLPNKLFWLLTLLTFNPFLLLIYILYGRKPRRWSPANMAAGLIPVMLIVCLMEIPWSRMLPQRPQEIPHGQLVRETSRLGTALHIGLNTSQTNSSSSSSTGSSDRQFFSAARIYVMNTSPDQLARRAALGLVDALLAIPGVQQVVYFPPGAPLPLGERLPDLFITLESDDLHSLRLPGYRHTRGTLNVNASTQPFNYSGSADGESNSSRISSTGRIELEFQTSRIGFETAEAVCEKESDDLAKNLSDTITKNIKSLADKHASPPPLPPVAYGRALTEPPPLPPLPAALHPQLVIAGSDLFDAFHAVWTFEDTRSTTDTINDIEKSLRDAQWPDVHVHLNDSTSLTSKDKSRTLWIERPGFYNFRVPRPANEPHRYFLHLVTHFTEAEERTALTAILAADPRSDILAKLLYRARNIGMEPEFMQQLEAKPPTSPDTALRLARIYQGRKDFDKVKRCFDFARILLVTEKDATQTTNDLKQFAENELHKREWLDTPIPETTWSEIALPWPQTDATYQLTVGKPLIIHQSDQNDFTWMATVEPAPAASKQELPLQLRTAAIRVGGSSSWMTSGFLILDGARIHSEASTSINPQQGSRNSSPSWPVTITGEPPWTTWTLTIQVPR